jgi:hypothetical protein
MIGEDAGPDLQGFVENVPLLRIDGLGLCSQEEIEHGKATLLAKYQEGADKLAEKGVPTHGSGPYSCDSVNNAMLNFITSGGAKCWKCVEERRSRLAWGFPRKVWRDHWVVVCTSTSGGSIAFDYWGGMPPGFDPQEFYRKYPTVGAPESGNPGEVVHLPKPNPNALDALPPDPDRTRIVFPYL